MGGLVAGGHEVDGIARGGKEKKLEDGVVGGVGEGPEQIEVAGYVDDKVQSLRFEGDTGAGLGGLLERTWKGGLPAWLGAIEGSWERTFV
jgi:hypothetical protein